MPVAVADASLGERVRQGDAAAFSELYTEYAPGIYDFLARLVHDRAAAEDLTQATFIAAFEHRASVRDPSKIRSWLWSTAHNQAMNYLARQRKSDSLDEQFDLATLARGPEESAEAKDAAELVWLAAASLEPRQYTVLDLTVRRDLSTPEVAETLGIPVGHAAVLVNRAREALGNAVRYLLVARRREQCEQLAALVPAGVRALTPEQRSAVDHHMRRCEQCRELGDRLTAPAELLGGFTPLPMPAHLLHVDWIHGLSATHPAKAVQTPRRPRGRQAAQHTARSVGHHALSSAVQVVATVVVAVAVAVPQAGSAASPTSPLALSAGASSHAQSAANQRGASAAPIATSNAPPSALVTPSAPQPLIAIAEPAPAPFSSWFRTQPGQPFTTKPTMVKLFRPDGTLVDTLTLRSGIRILAAAGSRIFLLEPGGVLKAVKTDGNVEDLGNLGSDLYKIGAPLNFVTNADGTQWLWGTLDSGSVDFASTPTKTLHSSIHLAGIGLAPRTVDQADRVNQVLDPWGWPATGPVIAVRQVCCGLGGGPVAFGDPYDSPSYVLNLNTGATALVNLPAGCPPWDYAADGTFACHTGFPGPDTQLTVTVANGTKQTIKTPNWIWQTGDGYQSPVAPVVAVGAVGEYGQALGPYPFGRYETYLVNMTDGTLKPLALSGVLPAMWERWWLSSWLADGSLMVFRLPGSPGGDSGTYVVRPGGASINKVSPLGPPIGSLQASKPVSSGYATAAEAAQAGGDALMQANARSRAAAGSSPVASGCDVFHLGKGTFGVNAAYFTGGVACQVPGGGGYGAAIYTYVYKDSGGWHYLDARGTNGPAVPAIGMQGPLILSSGCINVREAPGLSGRILSCLANGTTVKVDGGPNYVDQKLWWHLQGLGWMAHEFLACGFGASGLLPNQC